MKTFNFKTDFLLSDYRILCWHRAWKSVTLLSVAGGIFVYLSLERLLNAVIAFLPFIALLACVGIFFIMKFYISNRAKKIYEISNASDELDIVINETGITQFSAKEETTLEWDDISKVEETKDYYYLYFGRQKNFYFPKRSFLSKEHEREFIDWVCEYVNPLRIKFKK